MYKIIITSSSTCEWGGSWPIRVERRGTPGRALLMRERAPEDKPAIDSLFHALAVLGRGCVSTSARHIITVSHGPRGPTRVWKPHLPPPLIKKLWYNLCKKKLYENKKSYKYNIIYIRNYIHNLCEICKNYQKRECYTYITCSIKKNLYTNHSEEGKVI